MQIAPGFTDADYKRLNLDDQTSPDWQIAIDIFEARIGGRYVEPVDAMIQSEAQVQNPRNRKYGFAVLAIDCLLIEAFYAFINGLKHTRNQSRNAFTTFLTTRPLFQRHFTAALAGQFYDEYRCGILHQAEVQGDSIIWSVGAMMRIDGGGLVINRNAFHEALKNEITSYVNDLRKNPGTHSRAMFRRKMNYVCRV